MTEREKERHSFAASTSEIDWSQVIFTGMYNIGRNNIWTAIDTDGPCGIRIFNYNISPLLTSGQYIAILNQVVLPIWNRNENLILMQVSY